MSDALSNPIAGMHWQIAINGRRSANGRPLSENHRGDIAEADQSLSIFDAARSLLDYAERDTSVAYPTAIQITLGRPEDFSS
ncbi:MAG TPA: hypothetical protein VIM61_00675 [Chthoniobacterales bacterium]